MKAKWTDRITQAMDVLFAEPVTKYVIIITLIISALLITQAWVDGSQRDGRFLSLADKQLALSFVEWFGVVYGFLLPTILVRVWEQFDEIDNVLDREADAVKRLVGDLLLLDEQYEAFRDQVLCSLLEYSRNLIRFVEKKISSAEEIEQGELLLKEVRGHYINIFHSGLQARQTSEILKGELLTQLNDLIKHRGNRISLSTQRLFESLNLIAVVTSILWLVPFYFLYFQNPQTGEDLHLGFFGRLLVIFVTFLIIMILSIIDDLDKPFDGYWVVNIKSWTDLVANIEAEHQKLQAAKQNSSDILQEQEQAGPAQTEATPSFPPAEEAKPVPAREINTIHSAPKGNFLIKFLAIRYLIFRPPKQPQ